MKCIYPDNIGSLVASNTNDNYPVENLRDYHPKKPWRGTGRVAVLTISCSQSSGIAIINTNAESINVEISAGQAIEWGGGYEWDSDYQWDDGSDPHSSASNLAEANAFWAEWDERSVNHTIIVTLTAPEGEIIQAGVVTVGMINNFPDPATGLSEKLIDYSVKKRLNNGAPYIKLRDIVRQFSGSINVTRDVGFYEFMSSIVRERGSLPLAWKISDSDNWRWVVYAMIWSMPQGTHGLRSEISFTLEETI